MTTLSKTHRHHHLKNFIQRTNPTKINFVYFSINKEKIMYIVYLLIVVLLILGIVDKIEKTIKESPMNIVYIMIGGSIGALIIYFLF